MKKMTYLVVIALLLYNIQSSESPVIGSRLADWELPTAQPLVQGHPFCPPHIAETQCECAYKERRMHVDCRGMNMPDFPSVFPPDTWKLDLSENPIEKIGPGDLRNLDLLVEFICYGCQLTELTESFRYTIKLQRIQLDNNSLTHINTNLFENLKDLRFVDLRNNPDLNQNCISELTKKYPKVEFKFSVDMDNTLTTLSTSTENDTTKASTENVETLASDTSSSGTQTSHNTGDTPPGSTVSEFSTSEPKTTVLTHAKKPTIKDNATTASTWTIVGIGSSIVVFVCLALGFGGWMTCKVRFGQQNRPEIEQDHNNADTRTTFNSTSPLMYTN